MRKCLVAYSIKNGYGCLIMDFPEQENTTLESLEEIQLKLRKELSRDDAVMLNYQTIK